MCKNVLLSFILILAPLAAVSTLTGCEDKKPATSSPGSTGASGKKADDHGHDHDHDHAGSTPLAPGHGGPVIDLGEQVIGTFSAKATRDQGDIVAGKDAPIDVSITPAAGSALKTIAVRFWIGTQDAKGSAKAKAEIEDAKNPNRWHTHVEIPSPLPAGSKLYVEIEDDKGGKNVGGFELKL